MKSVFIIHSYNADTKDSFSSSIEKLCKNNNIEFYLPDFSVRSDAKYDKWEKILKQYYLDGKLNENSIVIAHSLGTQFMIKFIAKNNIKIDKYISVAGFIGFKGREDLEKILESFQPTEEEYLISNSLINKRYSIYSDNDELNDISKLEKYAEKINGQKILLHNCGHFNPKSNVKEITEINNIILDNENDEKYIDIAIEISKKSKFPYGAIVVKDNKIIGRSDDKTIIETSIYTHAELAAIESASINKSLYGDLKGATIYTSCQPCMMCMGAILYEEISKIVYAASLQDSNDIYWPETVINIDDLAKYSKEKIEIVKELHRNKAIEILKERAENYG